MASDFTRAEVDDPMKKTFTLLFLTALLLASMTGEIRRAAADFYQELEVRLEVRGTGSFTMEEEGNPQNLQTITASGQGFFVCRFSEPGNYRYRIRSDQPDQKDRYVADICVYQGTRAENELYAIVTVTNEADSRKLDTSVIEYSQTPSPDRSASSSGTGSSGSDGTSGKSASVRTGDSFEIVFYLFLIGISALLTEKISQAGLFRRK